MLKAFLEAAKSLLGGGSSTEQIGSNNTSISGIKVDSNSGMVIAGHTIQVFQSPTQPKAERNDFSEVERLTASLLEYLRTALDKHPNIREFVLHEPGSMYNVTKPAIVVKLEDFPNAESLADLLEQKGLIKDVSKTRMKRYRLSEPFAQYLQLLSVEGGSADKQLTSAEKSKEIMLRGVLWKLELDDTWLPCCPQCKRALVKTLLGLPPAMECRPCQFTSPFEPKEMPGIVEKLPK